jgi:triosephosphate isomerase
VRRTAGRAGRDLVIGVSLKMYFSYRETLDWCARVRSIAAASPLVSEGAARLFVMPASPFLLPVIEMFRGTPIQVGAQNIYFEDRGPFTGELSGSMLSELGCRWVEVGHAERRRLFGESNRVVALKVEAAIRNHLFPVICVGEDEASSSRAVSESIKQVRSALARAARNNASAPVVIAYEPLRAIGAEEPASVGHIAEVCLALQDFLRHARPGTDDRVIYGGSAGPGLLERLGDAVDGLFLGRFVHNVEAFESVLEEANAVHRRRSGGDEFGL